MKNFIQPLGKCFKFADNTQDFFYLIKNSLKWGTFEAGDY